MTSYADNIAKRRAELPEAQGALARDLAAAINQKAWHQNLRDAHDIRAPIDKIDEIDEMAREPKFFETLHATADQTRDTRDRRRGRGRPRKPARTAAQAPEVTEAVPQP